MKVIRRGVFETNSSMTHSITICTKEEYEKWKKGELLFDIYNKKFIPKEKVEPVDKFVIYYEDDYATYDDYFNDYYTFEVEYTTPKGDEIVAFGKYSYDG